MNEVVISKSDELVMKLTHYFITQHNYKPVIVHGGQNEIWLENLDYDYKLIRLNSNYIHNIEQFEMDNRKVNLIVKQIKKKTYSFKCDTLNILLNSNIEVKDVEGKVKSVSITTDKDINKSNFLLNIFPTISRKIKYKEKGIVLFSKLSQEIASHNDKKLIDAKRLFQKSLPYVTYALIILNVICYLFTSFFNDSAFGINAFGMDLLSKFALYPEYVASGEWYRVITSTFLHADLFHLLFNMYALNVIGSQIEHYYGKVKYLVIYLLSGIMGSLFSILITSNWSIGASGAIFGLLGAILYFGYNYRLYLGSALKSQIIPLIVFNLIIGALIPNIDLAGHIGGLIGGILIAMACGIKEKKNNTDRTNGIIISLILFGFLIFMILNNI